MRYISLWLVFRDPPEHTRLRRLMASAINPHSVEAFRANAVDIAQFPGPKWIALRIAADICPARTPEAIRARLAATLAMLASHANFDQNRLYQEALLLAAKADIREELDRLETHLQAVRDLLNAGGAIGRKLDFLAQELGREANTLCAKSNDASLTAIGLELRVEIEQFREQVQNIE